MDYERKQREAFYLIKKYSSYTWYTEIYRLWKLFCEGYERDFYRKPIQYPPDSYHAGMLYEPGEYDEQNLRMFWGQLGEMEEGLALLRQGNKARGYEYLASGTQFHETIYSRRFEFMDLSDFGYRRGTVSLSEGIFVYAQKAKVMAVASAIYMHIDRLRRDYDSLLDNDGIEAALTNHKLKIPLGVPPGELPPLPTLAPDAPTVMSGEEVPAMGIWVIEPDDAHRDQTYCMAYLRPWAPALLRVSEQEYENNTRWIRTKDETYHKDSDKIKDYPVKWRLLWRDDRDYSNGNVPPEEADYLIYRESSSMSETDPEMVRLRCEGGQPCPRTGIWQTPASKDSRRMFKAGDTMPDYPNAEYGKTIWQWDGEE